MTDEKPINLATGDKALLEVASGQREDGLVELTPELVDVVLKAVVVLVIERVVVDDGDTSVVVVA